MKCETCGVELPENAWFDIHRLHADSLFIAARKLTWEASFMVDGNEPAVSMRVAVLDAECMEVCIAPSHAAAEMIVKALEEFWANHTLDGGEPR